MFVRIHKLCRQTRMFNHPQTLINSMSMYKYQQTRLHNDLLFNDTSVVIGRVEKVHDHPDAESLYLLDVDVGNEDTVTVVSGLKNYYTQEQLDQMNVCVIQNLKPKKLRGIVSNEMILAGSEIVETDKIKVVLCSVPEDVSPGTRVVAKENDIQEATPRVNSKKWKKIVEKLHVLDERVCFDNHALLTTNGVPINVVGLTDRASIN
mmetsp:Transcript_79/g.136  ORF Transcript_79/g.136 Transcript_79/m.136 type:complete len:206 (+) Transcript_79:1301-1918(+)